MVTPVPPLAVLGCKVKIQGHKGTYGGLRVFVFFLFGHVSQLWTSRLTSSFSCPRRTKAEFVCWDLCARSPGIYFRPSLEYTRCGDHFLCGYCGCREERIVSAYSCDGGRPLLLKLENQGGRGKQNMRIILSCRNIFAAKSRVLSPARQPETPNPKSRRPSTPNPRP